MLTSTRPWNPAAATSGISTSPASAHPLARALAIPHPPSPTFRRASGVDCEGQLAAQGNVGLGACRDQRGGGLPLDGLPRSGAMRAVLSTGGQSIVAGQRLYRRPVRGPSRVGVIVADRVPNFLRR